MSFGLTNAPSVFHVSYEFYLHARTRQICRGLH
jgi:hypothetical protein